MTDIDPLVERLHLYGGVRVPEEKRSCSENVCMEAANRIQSDAKIIEELRAALEPYGKLPLTELQRFGQEFDVSSPEPAGYLVNGRWVDAETMRGKTISEEDAIEPLYRRSEIKG